MSTEMMYNTVTGEYVVIGTEEVEGMSSEWQSALVQVHGFMEGEKVVVKHQRELGVCVVVNPYDETDMVRVGGGAVGHYVRIDTPRGKNQGYHEENLERVGLRDGCD